MSFEEMLNADQVWADRQNAWVKIGIREGFISPPCCVQCDGVSVTAEEDDSFFEGDGACIYTMRLYHDEFERLACEQHHPPSVWRKDEWL